MPEAVEPIPFPTDADRARVAVSFDDSVGLGDRLADAVAAGMDVAEARIDRFASTDPAHVVATLGHFSRNPTVATVRSAAEGGAWRGDEGVRLELYRAALGVVGAVDVEASSTAIVDDVVAAAHAAQRVAIVSFHDFDRTPSEADLVGTVARARDLGADVVKVATMVHGTDDLRTLARVLCTDHGVPLVVIGMGEAGVASRLLFPLLGSRLTFASFGASSAPGQVPLADTVATLRLASPS